MYFMICELLGIPRIHCQVFLKDAYLSNYSKQNITHTINVASSPNVVMLTHLLSMHHRQLMVVGLVVVQGLCLPVGPNQLFLLRQGYNWGTRNLFFCVRISWFGWGYLFQWLRTTLTDVAWVH